MAFWALLGDPNNSTPKGTGGARCTAGFQSDLCPLWVQKQTSRRHLANVRFTSQSGHARVASRSPAQKVYILHKKLSLSGALCAKPGPDQGNQQHLISATIGGPGQTRDLVGSP